jgi:hypothetical protein
MAAAAVLLLAGCGIRATSVPVDGGAAPSRSKCAEPTAGPSAKAAKPPAPSLARQYRFEAVELYLVCNSQVTEVKRAHKLSGDYTAAAGGLLGELRMTPGSHEQIDGYSTAVPDTLELRPRRPGDPEGTLRLNTELDRLPDFALGQLVCTFSHDLMDGGAVLLGGAHDTPVRKFTCSVPLRTQAGAEPDTGVPV